MLNRDQVVLREAQKVVLLARRAAKATPAEVPAILDELQGIASELDEWCYHEPECQNGDHCVVGEPGGAARREAADLLSRASLGEEPPRGHHLHLVSP